MIAVTRCPACKQVLELEDSGIVGEDDCPNCSEAKVQNSVIIFVDDVMQMDHYASFVDDIKALLGLDDKS